MLTMRSQARTKMITTQRESMTKLLGRILEDRRHPRAKMALLERELEGTSATKIPSTRQKSPLKAEIGLNPTAKRKLAAAEGGSGTVRYDETHFGKAMKTIKDVVPMWDASTNSVEPLVHAFGLLVSMYPKMTPAQEALVLVAMADRARVPGASRLRLSTWRNADEVRERLERLNQPPRGVNLYNQLKSLRCDVSQPTVWLDKVVQLCRASPIAAERLGHVAGSTEELANIVFYPYANCKSAILATNAAVALRDVK